MTDSDAVRVTDRGIWIHYQAVVYGPFNYQWSPDLYGIELIYRGEKFGECCGQNGLWADLAGFSLPATVVQLAVIVLGTIVQSIPQGTSIHRRVELVRRRLVEHGFEWIAAATSVEAQG